MPESRVVIFRSYDPTRIDLAEAQLRAAQIQYTRTGRGNAALLGAGNSIVEQVLEVAEEHAGEAAALLDTGAAPEPSEAPDAAAPEALRPKRVAFIAAGASLMWPGLGAAYVGVPITGLAIGIWAFVALVRAPETPDPLGMLLFGHLLPRAVDLLGSQLWLRRRGRRGVDLLPQVAIALSILALSHYSQKLLAGHLSQLVSSLGRKAPAEDWPFDQAATVAAISDDAVLEGGAPILLVIHYADDDSWAFLSDGTATDDEQAVIAMETALTLDPTLRSIATLPPGWSARRDRLGGSWTREVLAAEE